MHTKRKHGLVPLPTGMVPTCQFVYPTASYSRTHHVLLDTLSLRLTKIHTHEYTCSKAQRIKTLGTVPRTDTDINGSEHRMAHATPAVHVWDRCPCVPT